MGIFWRKTLSSVISPVDIDDDSLIAVRIDLNGCQLICVCVYMPCDMPANTDSFLEKLGKLEALLDDYNSYATWAILMPPLQVDLVYCYRNFARNLDYTTLTGNFFLPTLTLPQ